MATKTRNPYLQQAQAEAQLRYGPEAQALNYLFQRAVNDYRTGRGQSQSAMRSIIAAAQQARQPLLADYQRVAGSTQATNQQVTQALQGLNPEAASQRLGAVGNEAQIAANNLGLSAQAGISLLAQMQARAASAGAYQGDQLRRQYLSDVGQIADQQRSLAKDAGTYASLAYDKALQARADRHLKYAHIRAENNRAGQSADDRYLTKFGLTRDQFLQLAPDERQQLMERVSSSNSSGARPTHGLGSRTAAAEQGDLDHIESALSFVQSLGPHQPLDQVRAWLTQGTELKDAAGNKRKLPQIAPFYVDGAIDLYRNQGRFSPQWVSRLHGRGIHVPAQYRPLTGANKTVYNVGSILGSLFGG